MAARNEKNNALKISLSFIRKYNNPIPINDTIQYMNADRKYFLKLARLLLPYKKFSCSSIEGMLCQRTKYNANPHINDAVLKIIVKTNK
jgi:hypothetical protein